MADVPDHYAILGVLPSADIEIIRAAHRVLAKRYHPDTTTLPQEEARRRFRQIQDAYDVLSDPSKRKQYNASRAAGPSSGEYDADTEEADADTELEADWQFAVEYFPEAERLAQGLRQLSPSLALAFRTTLLRSRQFDHASKVGAGLRGEFLSRFFGQNEEVQDLAEACLRKGRRDAALEINRAVKILGASLNSEVVRDRINKKFNGLFAGERAKPKNIIEKMEGDKKLYIVWGMAFTVFLIAVLLSRVLMHISTTVCSICGHTPT